MYHTTFLKRTSSAVSIFLILALVFPSFAIADTDVDSSSGSDVGSDVGPVGDPGFGPTGSYDGGGQAQGGGPSGNPSGGGGSTGGGASGETGGNDGDRGDYSGGGIGSDAGAAPEAANNDHSAGVAAGINAGNFGVTANPTTDGSGRVDISFPDGSNISVAGTEAQTAASEAAAAIGAATGNGQVSPESVGIDAAKTFEAHLSGTACDGCVVGKNTGVQGSPEAVQEAEANFQISVSAIENASKAANKATGFWSSVVDWIGRNQAPATDEVTEALKAIEEEAKRDLEEKQTLSLNLSQALNPNPVANWNAQQAPLTGGFQPNARALDPTPISNQGTANVTRSGTAGDIAAEGAFPEAQPEVVGVFSTFSKNENEITVTVMSNGSITARETTRDLATGLQTSRSLSEAEISAALGRTSTASEPPESVNQALANELEKLGFGVEADRIRALEASKTAYEARNKELNEQLSTVKETGLLLSNDFKALSPQEVRAIEAKIAANEISIKAIESSLRSLTEQEDMNRTIALDRLAEKAQAVAAEVEKAAQRNDEFASLSAVGQLDETVDLVGAVESNPQRAADIAKQISSGVVANARQQAFNEANNKVANGLVDGRRELEQALRDMYGPTNPNLQETATVEQLEQFRQEVEALEQAIAKTNDQIAALGSASAKHEVETAITVNTIGITGPAQTAIAVGLHSAGVPRATAERTAEILGEVVIGSVPLVDTYDAFAASKAANEAKQAMEDAKKNNEYAALHTEDQMVRASFDRAHAHSEIQEARDRVESMGLNIAYDGKVGQAARDAALADLDAADKAVTSNFNAAIQALDTQLTNIGKVNANLDVAIAETAREDVAYGILGITNVALDITGILGPFGNYTNKSWDAATRQAAEINATPFGTATYQDFKDLVASINANTDRVVESVVPSFNFNTEALDLSPQNQAVNVEQGFGIPGITEVTVNQETNAVAVNVTGRNLSDTTEATLTFDDISLTEAARSIVETGVVNQVQNDIARASLDIQTAGESAAATANLANQVEAEINSVSESLENFPVDPALRNAVEALRQEVGALTNTGLEAVNASIRAQDSLFGINNEVADIVRAADDTTVVQSLNDLDTRIEKNNVNTEIARLAQLMDESMAKVDEATQTLREEAAREATVINDAELAAAIEKIDSGAQKSVEQSAKTSEDLKQSADSLSLAEESAQNLTVDAIAVIEGTRTRAVANDNVSAGRATNLARSVVAAGVLAMIPIGPTIRAIDNVLFDTPNPIVARIADEAVDIAGSRTPQTNAYNFGTGQRTVAASEIARTGRTLAGEVDAPILADFVRAFNRSNGNVVVALDTLTEPEIKAIGGIMNVRSNRLDPTNPARDTFDKVDFAPAQFSTYNNKQIVRDGIRASLNEHDTAKYNENKTAYDALAKAFLDGTVANRYGTAAAVPFPNATHYVASYRAQPSWTRNLIEVGRVGNHIFYTVEGTNQSIEAIDLAMNQTHLAAGSANLANAIPTLRPENVATAASKGYTPGWLENLLDRLSTIDEAQGATAPSIIDLNSSATDVKNFIDSRNPRGALIYGESGRAFIEATITKGGAMGVKAFETRNPKFEVQVYGSHSGIRTGGSTGNHGLLKSGIPGRAIDWVIKDKETGKFLTNHPGKIHQNQGTVGGNAHVYQELFNDIVVATYALNPTKARGLKWGGYFADSNPMDTMHVGAALGQGGGNALDGFTSTQMRNWDISTNKGLGSWDSVAKLAEERYGTGSSDLVADSDKAGVSTDEVAAAEKQPVPSYETAVANLEAKAKANDLVAQIRADLDKAAPTPKTIVEQTVEVANTGFRNGVGWVAEKLNQAATAVETARTSLNQWAGRQPTAEPSAQTADVTAQINQLQERINTRQAEIEKIMAERNVSRQDSVERLQSTIGPALTNEYFTLTQTRGVLDRAMEQASTDPAGAATFVEAAKKDLDAYNKQPAPEAKTDVAATQYYDGALKGLPEIGVKQRYTGGYGITATQNAKPFAGIVTHHSAGTLDSVIKEIETQRTGANGNVGYFGYHVLIGKDENGVVQILQLAPENVRTNHIGDTEQGSVKSNLDNSNAIGIAIVLPAKSQAQFNADAALTGKYGTGLAGYDKYVGDLANNTDPAVLNAYVETTRAILDNYNIRASADTVQSHEKGPNEGVALRNAVLDSYKDESVASSEVPSVVEKTPEQTVVRTDTNADQANVVNLVFAPTFDSLSITTAALGQALPQNAKTKTLYVGNGQNLADVMATLAALPPGTQVNLIGWSKGAIAALYIANQLNGLGMPVANLLMIDPGQGTVGLELAELPSIDLVTGKVGIPDNVQNVKVYKPKGGGAFQKQFVEPNILENALLGTSERQPNGFKGLGSADIVEVNAGPALGLRGVGLAHMGIGYQDSVISPIAEAVKNSQTQAVAIEQPAKTGQQPTGAVQTQISVDETSLTNLLTTLNKNDAQVTQNGVSYNGKTGTENTYEFGLTDEDGTYQNFIKGEFTLTTKEVNGVVTEFSFVPTDPNGVLTVALGQKLNSTAPADFNTISGNMTVIGKVSGGKIGSLEFKPNPGQQITIKGTVPLIGEMTRTTDEPIVLDADGSVKASVGDLDKNVISRLQWYSERAPELVGKIANELTLINKQVRADGSIPQNVAAITQNEQVAVAANPPVETVATKEGVGSSLTILSGNISNRVNEIGAELGRADITADRVAALTNELGRIKEASSLLPEAKAKIDANDFAGAQDLIDQARNIFAARNNTTSLAGQLDNWDLALLGGIGLGIASLLSKLIGTLRSGGNLNPFARPSTMRSGARSQSSEGGGTGDGSAGVRATAANDNLNVTFDDSNLNFKTKYGKGLGGRVENVGIAVGIISAIGLLLKSLLDNDGSDEDESASSKVGDSGEEEAAPKSETGKSLLDKIKDFFKGAGGLPETEGPGTATSTVAAKGIVTVKVARDLNSDRFDLQVTDVYTSEEYIEGLEIGEVEETEYAEEGEEPSIIFNEYNEVVYSDGTFAPVTVDGIQVDESGFEYLYVVEYYDNGEPVTIQANSERLPENFFTDLVSDFFSNNDSFTISDVAYATRAFYDPKPDVPRDELYEYTIILNNGSARKVVVPEYTSYAFLSAKFAEAGYQGDVLLLVAESQETIKTADYSLLKDTASVIANGFDSMRKLLGLSSDAGETTTDLNTLTPTNDGVVNMNDIRKATVFFGIEADCPDTAGLDQPYLYEIVIAKEALPNAYSDVSFRALRCGTGDKQTYVNEVAGHLESLSGFGAIDREVLYEMLRFGDLSNLVFDEPATTAGDEPIEIEDEGEVVDEETPPLIPNTTNEVSFEVKAVNNSGTVLADWVYGDLEISSGVQLFFRWNGENYAQCLPFLNDNGLYSLTRASDPSLNTGDTESEGYNVKEGNFSYRIECGGQDNGETGVDIREIDVIVGN